LFKAYRSGISFPCVFSYWWCQSCYRSWLA
jgi:hypothetical protein